MVFSIFPPAYSPPPPPCTVRVAPNLYAAPRLLLLRAALSQRDVPTRTSYVMAVCPARGAARRQA